jgi:aspartate racemase
VVADEARARGFRRVGLLGTRWLVTSGVYPERLEARGIAWLRPAPADVETVHHVIMDELIRGVFLPRALADVQAVIERLRDAGCDAVVLGCTELPLIVSDAGSALPALDSTRLLARAALRRAAGGN